MDDSRTFGSLVSGLSLTERKIFLEKLSRYSSFPQKTLYEEEIDAGSMPVHKEGYKYLPWYSRLSFVFLSLLRGAPPTRLFEERQIAMIGRWINETAPGIYDYQRDLLLPELYKRLVALKEAARFFYTVLDQSINRDIGGVYAFLGSLEMEDIHSRLTEKTDPELLIAANPQVPEAELRQIALENLEEALAFITEKQKNIMYANTRSLHCLKALSTFSFNRIILKFSDRGEGRVPVCAAGVVKDQLTSLQNVLFSLKRAPSLALLESLFVFTLREYPQDKRMDITMEMDRLLTQAEKSLNTIHDFNREVPLTQILRCTSRNLTISPLDISGGEEWFSVYRDYWKHYVHDRFTQYIRTTGQQKLLDSIYQFLRTTLTPLNHMASESNPRGIPVKGGLCLSFLLTFYSTVFMEKINGVLESVLLGGNFYSREDRTAFTESYNELMKLENIIRQFEMRISPVGELGKQFLAAQVNRSLSSLKRHKLLSITDEANQEVFTIVRTTGIALEGIINMLEKILRTVSGGESVVLINMAQLAGKGNVFITDLTDALVQLQETHKLFTKIIALELGK
ncbi:MAG: DUF5312 domain-containing protein [Treponema sp.]|jgi:hypothetical protein|nr:DUF5312 domain-containing protein [Treponema sp.]